jgi:hypothetical protein
MIRERLKDCVVPLSPLTYRGGVVNLSEALGTGRETRHRGLSLSRTSSLGIIECTGGFSLAWLGRWILTLYSLFIALPLCLASCTSSLLTNSVSRAETTSLVETLADHASEP